MLTMNNVLLEEPPSIQQLQMELHLMTLKVDKLTKENVDLKQHVKKTVGNDSKLRQDYEAQSIEKDRLSKVVDQLKNEKKSLVETVLQLSNEVDTMHRKASDHFELVNQRFVHTEMMINGARRRLGLQITDVLEMHQIGNDHPLMKEISVIINNDNHPPHNISSVDSADLDTKLSLFFLPTPTTVTSSSDSFATEDGTTHEEGIRRLDAESLVANEHALYRQSQFMHDALYRGNGNLSETCHDNTPNPHFKPAAGLSSNKFKLLRNSGQKTGSVKSGESRRRQSATLERNETESVISSVSTHRSSERSNKIKTNHKMLSQITAENLAILNKMNEEEEGLTNDGSKIIPSNRNQQLDNVVRKTKTIEETTVSWWPKLF